MDKLAAILKELKQQKWYVIFALSVLCVMWLFKTEIGDRLKPDRIHVTDKFLESSTMVNLSLTELMNSVGGDRAYVFRFHNGVRYNDGSHKKKMSNEYEVTRNGVSRQAQNLQDIPVSLFPEFISGVTGGDFVYDNIAKIKDIKTRSILREQGIKSIVVMPYYDDEGHLMAMIGVDWVFSQFPVNPDCEAFKDGVKKIGQIIEYEKVK